MYDVVIIGSGPAGVAAALGFAENGIRPCLLDVGISKNPEASEIKENLYEYRRKQDCFHLTIGEDFRGLYNLDKQNKPLPAKLTAPMMAFVTEAAGKLSPITETNFSIIQSFACGGLANAWGAGLYRYTDTDLRKFPIRQEDLNSYYDKLTKEMGITGQVDDLSIYFGSAEYLQKPLNLSFNAYRLFKTYQKKRNILNSKGFYIGRPRLAVLSEPKNGRIPCNYSNLEFWQPGLPYIYTPLFTINKLVEENMVVYKRGFLVKSYTKGNGYIGVNAIRLEDNQPVSFFCKYLILAAGAINSAKIVLATRQDYQTRLKLFDNPAVQIPLVFPFAIGKKLDVNAFGLTQLNVVWDQNPFGDLLQCSILELTSLMRAEFFSRLPFSAAANVLLLRYLLPAMMVMQMFFPSSVQAGASLSLRENDTLLIQGATDTVDYLSISKKILRYLRMVGAFSHSALCVKVPAGHGIHYAGTLPMTDSPRNEYECDAFGRLNGMDNVFVVDGSLFPVLAAKNHSFTMMANAMRISYYISAKIRERK